MIRISKMNRLFEMWGLFLAGLLLCLSLILSGCNQTVCNQYWLKDKPDSILINTGIRSIQLPPITDSEKISQVVMIGLAQQTEKACKQAVLGDKWYNKSCGNHPQTRQNPPIGESMSVSGARESDKCL